MIEYAEEKKTSRGLIVAILSQRKIKTLRRIEDQDGQPLALRYRGGNQGKNHRNVERLNGIAKQYGSISGSDKP